MQIELIEGMIANKLELSGMRNEGGEGQCRSLLYHLFTAVEIFRLMVPQEKETVAEWYQLFAKDFRVNLFLKELKSKKNKEKTAPAPHRKEKNKKEKVQKTTHTTKGAASLFEIRQKAFWDTCLKFEPEYDRQLLLKFFCYWAEQVNGTELMLWETKKSWNMRLRLKAWSKKSYQLDDKAAALRLERAKGKATAKQVTADAAEREDANARLEQEIEARKQGAVSYEEWLKMKDTHSLVLCKQSVTSND